MRQCQTIPTSSSPSRTCSLSPTNGITWAHLPFDRNQAKTTTAPNDHDLFGMISRAHIPGDSLHVMSLMPLTAARLYLSGSSSDLKSRHSSFVNRFPAIAYARLSKVSTVSHDHIWLCFTLHLYLPCKLCVPCQPCQISSMFQPSLHVFSLSLCVSHYILPAAMVFLMETDWSYFLWVWIK